MIWADTSGVMVCLATEVRRLDGLVTEVCMAGVTVCTTVPPMSVPLADCGGSICTCIDLEGSSS